MDKELAYIILIPAGSLLWMLGGWKWKGWRSRMYAYATDPHGGLCRTMDE